MRRCAECDYPLADRSSTTRRRHAAVHDHWLHGVPLRGREQLEFLGTCLEFEMLLARPVCGPLAQWTVALTTDRLLRDPVMANGKPLTGEFPMLRPSPRSMLTHTVLLCGGSRVLGALYFEWRQVAGLHSWDAPADQIEPLGGSPLHEWSITYGWLHHSVRKRHIGPMVAAVVGLGVQRPVSELPILPPFTRKGGSVSRVLSPGKVRVAGTATPTSHSNLVYPFGSPWSPVLAEEVVRLARRPAATSAALH